jgi:hypothetical protein
LPQTVFAQRLADTFIEGNRIVSYQHQSIKMLVAIVDPSVAAVRYG